MIMGKPTTKAEQDKATKAVKDKSAKQLQQDIHTIETKAARQLTDFFFGRR